MDEQNDSNEKNEDKETDDSFGLIGLWNIGIGQKFFIHNIRFHFIVCPVLAFTFQIRQWRRFHH